MALSLLNGLLVAKHLRQGDGLVSIPASRRAERVFGVLGPGHSKLLSLGKLESADAEYVPRRDTCVKAFVRFLAARAEAEKAPEALLSS